MALRLYPANVYEDPPTEFNDHVNDLAERVHKAVQGWGADENALIQELGDETPGNRVKLYHCYKDKFGKDLMEVMESELGNRPLGFTMQVCTKVISF